MSATNPDFLDMVRRYFEHRTNKRHDEVLALCTKDIVVVNERDGEHCGVDAVRAYLEKNKSQGVWDEPKMVNEQQAAIAGKVRVYLIMWDVVAYFTFDESKIRRIEIKRGKLE